MRIHFATIILLALFLCCSLCLGVPAETNDPALVSVDHVRAVLDRKGNHFEVTEFVNLGVPQGKTFSRPEGFRIPMPRKASEVRPMGEGNQTIKFEDGAVIVHEPIDENGYTVRVIFNLPLENGKVVLEQDFQTGVASAQIVSIWNDGKAGLHGDGFTAAADLELSSGLIGQVMTAQEIKDGRVVAELKGVVDGPDGMRSMITLFLCVVLLLVGFMGWTRSRVAGNADPGEDGEQ